MIIFCEQGWLAAMTNVVAGGVLYRIHLYQNNYIPTIFSTVADFTEADFSGYGTSIVLTWGVPFINGSNQAEIDALAVTWTRSGGPTSNTVYGIYVTDNAGNLAYAERFPAPINMVSIGDAITYTPKATLINQ